MQGGVQLSLSRWVWRLSLTCGLACGGDESSKASESDHAEPTKEDASSKRTSSQDDAVKFTPERPIMLWKVTRDGLEPSWLFGTCHAGVMLEESLPESNIPLVEEASLFVSEVDTSEVNMFAMPEELFLPEGQTVESLLGQEVWKEL